MRKFESEVQRIKYQVLREVIKKTVDGTFVADRYKIPKTVVPGPEPITRCCVYKERAIVEERIEIAVESPKSKENNIVEVLKIACDQCPSKRFVVTEACRGCLAHRCMHTCPKEAITLVDGRAYINQDKCIECGRCREACPFDAISDVMRPCKKACGAKAIEIDEKKRAKINREKCINCGACVYKCPFGAISDRSEVVEIVNEIEASKNGNGKNVYAIIAPAISSQFEVSIGKVVSAIKKLGFKDVVEVALGADIVAKNEGMEYVEKVLKGDQDCLMSSCCPAFVQYILKNYPELSKYISTMVSPMVAIARFIKKTDKNAIVVFMGPCTAKKDEAMEEDINDAVDYVMTFEELEAMIDAYEVDAESCEEEALDNASFYGRIFARSGGLGDAVKQVLKEHMLEDADYKPVICNGIDECDRALKMLKFGKLPGNFIEGMACKGGCIGGAASLTHGPKDKTQVDKYATLSKEKCVNDATRVLDLDGVNLHRNRYNTKI